MTTQFSCCISNTNIAAALGIEIWIDNQQIFNQDVVVDPININYTLNDADGEHSLRFVMKNKQPEHTVIDSQGQIVSDARLQIKQIEFDGMNMDQIFMDHATYCHDFNGTQPECVEQFFGEIGCNGVVTLKYTAPIYLWLLEYM